MIPPLAVWKIRPSGVVPYRLMWARRSLTRSGGMGMVRVSWAARCLRPRSWRAVPWSVQAVPAREAETAKTILPHPLAGRYRSLSRSMTASDGRSAA
jgi:hypothetical protein